MGVGRGLVGKITVLSSSIWWLLSIILSVGRHSYSHSVAIGLIACDGNVARVSRVQNSMVFGEGTDVYSTETERIEYTRRSRDKYSIASIDDVGKYSSNEEYQKPRRMLETWGV